MREASLNFLEKLVNTPSPSGHGQRVWLDYVKEFADETFSDAYGNCVAVLNRGGGPRIMLAAHADEIGMVVNFISKDGFLTKSEFATENTGSPAEVTQRTIPQGRGQRIPIATQEKP